MPVVAAHPAPNAEGTAPTVVIPASDLGSGTSQSAGDHTGRVVAQRRLVLDGGPNDVAAALGVVGGVRRIAPQRDPDAELTVDLSEQGVLLPDGSTIDFDIDPFAKRMLLAGTDELGYLLTKEPDIAAWEAAHPPRIETRASA